MIDLSKIDEKITLARGHYSTVRAAHEDSKKELSVACSSMQSLNALILKRLQDDEINMQAINEIISTARGTLDEIERIAVNVESLAKQRAELKKTAWS